MAMSKAEETALRQRVQTLEADVRYWKKQALGPGTDEPSRVYVNAYMERHPLPMNSHITFAFDAPDERGYARHHVTVNFVDGGQGGQWVELRASTTLQLRAQASNVMWARPRDDWEDLPEALIGTLLRKQQREAEAK